MHDWGHPPTFAENGDPPPMRSTPVVVREAAVTGRLARYTLAMRHHISYLQLPTREQPTIEEYLDRLPEPLTADEQQRWRTYIDEIVDPVRRAGAFRDDAAETKPRFRREIYRYQLTSYWERDPVIGRIDHGDSREIALTRAESMSRSISREISGTLGTSSTIARALPATSGLGFKRSTTTTTTSSQEERRATTLVNERKGTVRYYVEWHHFHEFRIDVVVPLATATEADLLAPLSGRPRILLGLKPRSRTTVRTTTLPHIDSFYAPVGDDTA